jgi:hypothetical protein
MEIELSHIYEGQTVTIIGGGPSLKGFNFNRLRPPVIGTNHTPKFHPSDILVAIDARFHDREATFLDYYKGLKVTYSPTTRTDFIMAKLDAVHPNEDWHILRANLSGYFALALALHLGAARVILLGFDGGYDKEPNWHPYAYFGPGMNTYNDTNKYYDFYKDRNVVNVGMDSRIEAFRKVPLESNFYD